MVYDLQHVIGQCLGEAKCLIQIGIHENDGELIAPEAGDRIGIPRFSL